MAVYLNNRDLLREIHLSKNSYCSFLKPEYHMYDIIVESVDDIVKPEIIEAAKQNRAARLSKEQNRVVMAVSVDQTDLIFRVMTWDHIPLMNNSNQLSTQTSQILEWFELVGEDDPIAQEVEQLTDGKHERVNFPPFQHYKISKDFKKRCIGKSHWVGDLKTGHFSKTHGNFTDTLANMLLKFCDRYGSKSNWRGYTYNSEMQGQAILQLLQNGLQFNEAKSSNPFAYLTTVVTNSFVRILNIEKRHQAIRDDLLMQNGYKPSTSRQMSWTDSTNK